MTNVWTISSRNSTAASAAMILAFLFAHSLRAQSQIVLVSDRTSRFQVYTSPIGPASTPTQITTGGEGSQAAGEPDWSPPTTTYPTGIIAYQFGASGVRGIHTINPDGTGDVQITPPGSGSYPCADDTEPAWKPDGTYIAYVCENNVTYAIWQHNNSKPVNTPGSESFLYSISKAFLYNPTWTHDGTALAFVSSVPGNQPQIQLLNIATRKPQPLTNSAYNDFDPTFSPDDQTIAFSSTRNGTRQIFTMSVTCPETTPGCPAPVQLTMDTSGAQHCAWSSSGQYIAFASNRMTALNPTGKSQIYLLSSSLPEGPGNSAVAISDGTADDDQPAWPFASATEPGKSLGTCNYPGKCLIGEPIDSATGNMYEQVTDYETAGLNKLRFVRNYNSNGIMVNANTWARSLGVNWRSVYDRYLTLALPSTVTAERADGQVLAFTFTGGAWVCDTDMDITLVESGSTWTLTDHNDTVETYSAAGNEGMLTAITIRGGYAQTLQYNGSGQLASVTDTYSRLLQLTYSNGLLNTVTTPDGLVLTYGYNSSGVSPGVLDRLASITYSTTPATSQAYLYENTALPFALTGIIDEDGNRYATWTYDSTGRALTSQNGTGANLTTVSYDDATGNRTVTNASGEQEVYKFSTLQGVPKVTEIDRLATSTTAAATRLFTYDANGYTASTTDWNANLTMYVNDIHGDPTTINEAVGTPQARTTTIVYDPTFVHLPSTITTQGLVTAFVYDPNENLLTKTLTDTTSQTIPYSTNGQTRTWTNTWQNFLLASAKTPNGNLTKYAYDATGALIATTNPLLQVTNVTQHTGGGYPLVIVDPNNVTTTITYDARLRLLTSTVSATGQPSFTTTNGYDPAGNLTSVQLPDNSKLTYGYDTAHRLISTTDLFGNATTNTLDALGDVTLTTVTNPQSTVTRKHSGVFDALGRVLKDIGGVGQTTKYTYDNNGNALTITDPDGNKTQQTFDALNRLSTVTDPAPGGVTTNTFDQHDRILTVTDQNNNVTSYVYDGFGDKIETISPDTETTVYYYDPDSNLTQSKNASGSIANYTFDALDRVLTTTYPGDTIENVSYYYDQPSHGFGIGHLTTVKDAAGTLTRTYDERGNMLTDKRVNGSIILKAAYAYDPTSRISSITYPSATVVSYTRDSMGRIIKVKAKTSGAARFASVASSITYEPFGPADGLTFGNSIKETSAFDLDYRLKTLTDTGTTPVQNLVYGYDMANNVLSITDKVTTANNQGFLYDSLNRLTNATGAYATQAWTYDAVGNRLTQVAGGVSTSYGYAPGSNQLASITTGSATQTVGTTAAGNISSFAPAFGSVTNLTYDQANRLATTAENASTLTQYTYDGFGHRIVKVGSATATILFQYDQSGHLLEQTDGTGSAQVDYIYLADRPLAAFQPSNGKMYFLHDDRLGTPQRATDSAQAVAWSADYQPFGYTSTGIAAIVQNLRLPGQEFESETAWNHNGFRDYPPTIGRYLESDPLGMAGGVNSYQYSLNSPIVTTDPRGLLSTRDKIGLGLMVAGDVVFALTLMTPAAPVVVVGANLEGAEFIQAVVAAETVGEGGIAGEAGTLISVASATVTLSDPEADKWSIAAELLGMGAADSAPLWLQIAVQAWGNGDTLRTTLLKRALQSLSRGSTCPIGGSQGGASGFQGPYTGGGFQGAAVSGGNSSVVP
jgi:RHS repeat-associated protein